MSRVFKIVLSIIIVFYFVVNINTVKAENSFIVVGFNREINKSEVADIFNTDISNVNEIYKNTNIFEINIDYSVGGDTQNQSIKFIEPVREYRALLTPNDPYLSYQWGISKINATSAWSIETASSASIIAILDTGINALHEDLNAHTLAGYNCITNSAIATDTDSDDDGHGTFVAGIASAVTNNNIGIAGIGYNSSLMPVKVLNSEGVGTSTNIAQGIYYAVDNGADVINLSLGGEYPSTAIRTAIDYAQTNDVSVIAATGNDNSSISYPAKYEEVFAVGSSTSSDQRSSFSNYGSQIDVVAPGSTIASTYDSVAHDEYAYGSGTSYAAPFVSGLVSLVKTKYSSYNYLKAEQVIKDTADKVSAMGGDYFNNYYGYGRIDAYDAIRSLPNYYAQAYDYSVVSQNNYPSLYENDSYNFQLVIKNTGSANWYQNKVHLGTSNPLDRTPYFLREGDGPSGWVSANRIRMQQSVVAPGENATFSFWMKVPSGMNPATYREYFRPVSDGVSWMKDTGIYWDVTVKPPKDQYNYSITYQNAYPSISKGSAYNFVLKIRNTGTATWQKDRVNLGTSNPLDRISGFIREGDGPSGWLYYNRIAMQESSVTSGEVATFSFWMRAPITMQSKTYQEYFRPVADGITWMADKGIYWNITVND